MTRRSQFLGVCAALPCIAGTLLLSAPAARAQAALPTVAIDFVIESPKHVDNFKPDALRRQFELDMAAELARLSQDRFSFLKWVPVNNVGNASPAAQLTLTIKTESGSSFPGILLEYGAKIGGQPHAVEVTPERLYGGFDDQRTNDHVLLKQDLKAKVAQQFASDAFRRDLHEGFLRHIPLADSVMLREPQVIVPVNPDELGASHESVLLVLFKAKPSGSPEDGVIELIPLSEEGGSLGCLIRKLLFPTVVVDHLGGWNPNIPTILQSPVVVDVKVFMADYKKKVNPGTEGALSTRPE